MSNSKLPLSREEFTLLRDYIHTECGIVIGDEKSYLIESHLTRLVMESGCDCFKDFYLKAKNDQTNKLRMKIVDAMTTNETLWFRDVRPWTVVREIVIPKFIDELRTGKRNHISVWSAASSTGQEVYSFCMLLDEALRREPVVKKAQFHILATDISPSALYMAISGRYNSIAMSRGMLEGYRERYFKEVDGVSEIIPEIKKMVVFKQFNLQNDFANIPHCDLIFCRNVAIYFSPEFKTILLKKMFHKLNADGYFFMGGTENLIGHSADFEQLEYQRSIYYKPKKN